MKKKSKKIKPLIERMTKKEHDEFCEALGHLVAGLVHKHWPFYDPDRHDIIGADERFLPDGSHILTFQVVELDEYTFLS